MHDWMRTSGFTDVETLGIDIKSDVIASNNKIAQSIGYDGLEFINGTIDTTEDLQPDILVALHACDTATDDALFMPSNSKQRLSLSLLAATNKSENLSARMTSPIRY